MAYGEGREGKGRGGEESKWLMEKRWSASCEAMNRQII